MSEMTASLLPLVRVADFAAEIDCNQYERDIITHTKRSISKSDMAPMSKGAKDQASFQHSSPLLRGPCDR